MAKNHFFGQKFLWEANKRIELKMLKLLENHVKTQLYEQFLKFFVSPELSSVRDYVITLYVVCM